MGVNVAISFDRSENRRIRETVSIDEFSMDLAAADRVREAAGDDVRILHRLIGQLGELDRALIILYLDEHSHDEIAAFTGGMPTARRPHRPRSA